MIAAPQRLRGTSAAATYPSLLLTLTLLCWLLVGSSGAVKTTAAAPTGGAFRPAAAIAVSRFPTEGARAGVTNVPTPPAEVGVSSRRAPFAYRSVESSNARPEAEARSSVTAGQRLAAPEGEKKGRSGRGADRDVDPPPAALGLSPCRPPPGAPGCFVLRTPFPLGDDSRSTGLSPCSLRDPPNVTLDGNDVAVRGYAFDGADVTFDVDIEGALLAAANRGKGRLSPLNLEARVRLSCPKDTFDQATERLTARGGMDADGRVSWIFPFNFFLVEEVAFLADSIESLVEAADNLQVTITGDDGSEEFLFGTGEGGFIYPLNTREGEEEDQPISSLRDEEDANSNSTDEFGSGFGFSNSQWLNALDPMPLMETFQELAQNVTETITDIVDNTPIFGGGPQETFEELTQNVTEAVTDIVDNTPILGSGPQETFEELTQNVTETVTDIVDNNPIFPIFGGDPQGDEEANMMNSF